MKVILLENVAHVGKKYDLAEVKPGYARNFLLAKGLAEAVTKANAKRVAELQQKRTAELARQQELLSAAVGKLQDVKVTTTKKANEEGHLYAGISKEEVAALVKDTFAVEIPEDHVLIERPIKTLGDHEVIVKVKDAVAKITLTVKGEEE